MKKLHDYYVVHPDGSVFSLHYNKFLKEQCQNNRYLNYRLVVDGKVRQYSKHRLVAWYHGILEDLEDATLEVDHIDTNTFNNDPDNLQVLTQEEHINKTLNDRGLKRKTNLCIDCGGTVDNSKVTRCLSCHRKHISPKQTLEEIESLVTKLGWSGAGRSLSISDNALRKRYRTLGGNPKSIRKNIGV